MESILHQLNYLSTNQSIYFFSVCVCVCVFYSVIEKELFASCSSCLPGIGFFKIGDKALYQPPLPDLTEAGALCNRYNLYVH